MQIYKVVFFTCVVGFLFIYFIFIPSVLYLFVITLVSTTYLLVCVCVETWNGSCLVCTSTLLALSHFFFCYTRSTKYIHSVILYVTIVLQMCTYIHTYIKWIKFTTEFQICVCLFIEEEQHEIDIFFLLFILKENY